MTSKKRRAFHVGGASWLLLCAMADGAMAQDAAAPPASTQLPEITVTAPSPIVRRKPATPSRTPARVARAAPGRNREPRRSSRSRHRSPPRPSRACCPSSPISSRPSPSCRTRKSAAQGGATLGDLLFSKPGITGSSFAPGASSRPIIRGLDVNRVGIVENGIGSGGASDLGEDHFVPIDPLVDQPGRGHPRTGGAALRIDLDRRRRQRHQQPHSGCLALLRGRAVPELRAAGQGAAGQCAIARRA